MWEINVVFPQDISLTTSFYFYVYYFQNQKNMGSYKKIMAIYDSNTNITCHEFSVK